MFVSLMLKEFLSMSLIVVLIFSAFSAYLVATPVHAKANTVTVKCRNIAVALATLNIAIALSDKASLDASLNEGEIAPDLEEERHLLVDLTESVRHSCPHSFSDILHGLTFP
jgi:hypothetical protein